MRIAFVSAGQLAVTSARGLIEAGHEVVMVDPDEERLHELEELGIDCGLVHGDGSRPAILGEIGPESTDFLFCMSDSDQDNILAGLAGAQLGFGRVVVKIADPDFGGLCAQLGLEDLLVPSQETANAVRDRVSGIESVDLNRLIDSGLRFFAFAAREKDAGSVADLDLPDGVRVIAVTRDGEAQLASGETQVREKDEVYAICAEGRVRELRERFLDE